MTVIPDDEKYIEHNLDEILERLRSKIRTMIKRNRGIPKDEFIKMLEDSPKPNKESATVITKRVSVIEYIELVVVVFFVS